MPPRPADVGRVQVIPASAVAPGAAVLHEPVFRRRATAAALVEAGIALVARG
jgi:hypothetical protein